MCSARNWTVLVLFAFLVIAFAPATAQAEDVDLDIRRVALFKNGLGFYTATAEIPDDVTEVRFAQLPVPVFGTFWVGYDPDLKVSQFVARADESERSVPIRSLVELLRENVGKRVTLRTGLDGGEVLEGTLLGFDEETAPDDEESIQPRYPIPVSGFVALATDSGTVFLDASMVRRVDFPDGEIITSQPDGAKHPSLNLVLDEPARGEEIAVSYLAKGATWTPGYLVDLSDSKTAKFHASAVIVNEMEDLENVRLELVTGFPNIKFADVESPLARVRDLAGFLSALSGGAGYARGGMATQMLAYDQVSAREEMAAGPAPSYSSAAAGQTSEDLFLYPIDDFSLAKDETAWKPLFSAEMPYEHIYTWKIGNFVDAHSRYTRTESSGAAGEVWHSCRLTNTLDQPLTTAATEFMTDGQFVGQDTCYYTAAGAETTIRINRAMNVLVDQLEVEVQRQRQAIQLQHSWYDLVEVRGELELENKLDKTISLEVTKELSGEVVETAPEAEDVAIAKGLKQTNPHHRLTWEFDLKPGEKKTLTYRYKVYIVG